ncbi:transposase [Paracoccus denitrificans]|jgi:hypothetical protein|uniref:Transposase n=1 Tax=Paracoccus denitrificans (strain Pd 1222) TaxID=318586 RepID=A1B734_PARDP|nr:transposase [Paracoccus denitrificans]ABL71328.1 transposase [Paracoccus denitrificans PD1222]MBB4629949.1 hypothetical protein [Paracoccus denitrificans]MCU7431322.1 transposase [Paracoccus denitrificans]UPV97671.1 transposase [Paracoccus denitrificans]WQO35585.1 transposase [Paracoccus denitrificans]
MTPVFPRRASIRPGSRGKQDNCQAAVSLSIANEKASLPIAWRRYLPDHCAQDPVLRRKAKIPDNLVFQTRSQIALDQIRTAAAVRAPCGVVLADAGHGADGAFRAGLSELGLYYVVGVQPTLSVWRPDEALLPSDAIAALNAAFHKAMTDPEIRLREDVELYPTTPEELGATISRDIGVWREIVGTAEIPVNR